MFSRYRIEKLRKEAKLVSDEDVDDAALISKWQHRTNIEASDELLARLRHYHSLEAAER